MIHGYARHRKTIRLAKELGVSRHEAAGIIADLRDLCYFKIIDGGVGVLDDDEIAEEIGCPGRPEVVAALTAVGLLDAIGGRARLYLHDWHAPFEDGGAPGKIKTELAKRMRPFANGARPTDPLRTAMSAGQRKAYDAWMAQPHEPASDSHGSTKSGHEPAEPNHEPIGSSQEPTRSSQEPIEVSQHDETRRDETRRDETRRDKTRQDKARAIGVSLPPLIDTPEVREAYEAWGNHLAEVGKVHSPSMRIAERSLLCSEGDPALGKLARAGPERAEAILRLAVRSGWRTLHDIDPPREGQESDEERRRKRREKIMGSDE